MHGLHGLAASIALCQARQQCLYGSRGIALLPLPAASLPPCNAAAAELQAPAPGGPALDGWLISRRAAAAPPRPCCTDSGCQPAAASAARAGGAAAAVRIRPGKLEPGRLCVPLTDRPLPPSLPEGSTSSRPPPPSLK